MMKRLLIACSYSARERDAFRALGVDAWSCDFEPCEGDPAFHYQGDVFDIIHEGWDAMIAHPPCTFLANSGNKHLYIGMRKENGRNEERWEKQRAGAAFFRALWDAGIAAGMHSMVFENPIMHPEAKRLIGLGDQDQVVQPWWFGDPFFKATCHWRFGRFPDLVPTDKLTPPKPGTEEHKAWSAVHRAPPGPNRWKDRSRAFPGLVAAEAAQWSPYL